MAWEEELSQEQRRYASHQAARLRLVAGPGIGKTRVMTRRIAYLVEVKRVDPATILALTFTRAGARELREPLETLLGETSRLLSKEVAPPGL
jgi:ATP-dependent DNA helicase UvrD/PcrA